MTIIHHYHTLTYTVPHLLLEDKLSASLTFWECQGCNGSLKSKIDKSLIFPSSHYTFPCELVMRIWC